MNTAQVFQTAETSPSRQLGLCLTGAGAGAGAAAAQTSTGKQLRLYLMGAVAAITIAFALFFCMPAIAWAEDDEDSSGGDGIELAAKEGEATIVDHTNSDGTGKTSDLGDEDDLTFTNDLPSYTHIITKNVEEDKTVSDEYYLTENGQAITLPKDHKDPDDAKKTEGEVVDNEQVITIVTESQNAIQKAVDKALSSIQDDSTSVTISIKPGEYDGDITIDSSKATATSVDWSTFILFLVSEDQYKADQATQSYDASSEGLAIVNGNLIINGVKVEIIGLLFSPNTTTTIEDGQIVIYGTVQDDTIKVVLSGNEVVSVTVYGGDGNDTITVSGGTDNSPAATSSLLQLNIRI